MEAFLLSSVDWLLATLALPSVGLSAIFLVSFISATLLPLGSEPAVFGYIQLSPHMFWPAVLIATLGNTLGGATSYWMGLGAHKAYETWKEKHDAHEAEKAREAAREEGVATGVADPTIEQANAAALASAQPSEAPKGAPGGRWNERARAWMTRLGPPALLLSWLPVVGDPLCAAAGWLRLSFWPCVIYMAIGKFGRYVTMTAFLLWAVKEI